MAREIKEMENLKNNHKTSIKGIYTQYICKKLFHSLRLKISVILSAICFVLLFFFIQIDYYEILTKIINTNISIFPSLLGFCVGGYALIIGFGHKEMLQKMSDPIENKSNMSFFQIMSSVFAASTIILIITFLLSYIILFLINLEFVSTNELLCKIINIFTISLIIFFSIYSIILIYYMVINIFNFGQAMHFCIRNELLNKPQEKDATINKSKKTKDK